MRRLRISEDACIGCHLCEIWCVVTHSRSGDILECFKREFPRPLARVTVQENKPVTFPVQCRQCEEPICVYSCPSGAMSVAPDGSIDLDQDRCRSCWTCILVCPYGAIRRGPSHAIKCDLCRDREVPACVEHCPNEAIAVEDA